ncbi:MAG: hypothetical protein JW726_17640 [Anaerolineales bacterium]|nr:hypothetical protein [Anaerolineales bacterium]
MKKQSILMIVLALVFGACGPASTPEASLVPDTPAPAAVLDNPVTPAAPAPQDEARVTLDITYENALSERNQLALGILLLQGSANAIPVEQAQTLLPLWQLLLNLQGSGTAADAEVSAVLQSIEDSLTDEQMAAIQAMQLTQTDLQEWASANGVTLGSGTGTGTGQGQGQGMSPEARATRQAESGRTPGSASGGASTALVSAVIAYLDQLTP